MKVWTIADCTHRDKNRNFSWRLNYFFGDDIYFFSHKIFYF